MSSAQVMVVDDNPANLILLEEMLMASGLDVCSFSLGRLALAAARKRAPDLILLDINMPEMTGYEVCQRLKSEPGLAEIPVIFLSAMTAPEERLRCFQTGAVDYVAKPFHIGEVQARVDTHLRLRNLQKLVEDDNARLQALVEDQLKQIDSAHIETIFAIAKLAETRDGETGRHLERIQTLCRLLAEAVKDLVEAGEATDEPIDNDWVRDIYHASPLHDIGKVGIPDRILLKPGPLTEAEIAIMKTHTTLGARTLRKVQQRYPDNEFIEMGIQMAGSHHEKWDGTGYPLGLKEKQIPLCARILALADSYDALRSSRRYKSALPHEEACAIIVRECGTHFDPALIAVFQRLAPVFCEEWNRVEGTLTATFQETEKLPCAGTA